MKKIKKNYMKRAFLSLFVALSAVLMSVSCLNTSKYDAEQPDYAEIVTIVDGSYNSPFYVEFDSGKTASVTSSPGGSITFPSEPAPMRGEVRKLIWYKEEGTPDPGFDKSVNIISMENVATHLIYNTEDEEVEKVLDTHDDNVAVNVAVFAPYRNYLTLEMYFHQSSEISYKHSIFVAYNPSREGMYKEVYEAQKDQNDGYLWLELYHDAAGDVTTNNMVPVYSCVKLDAETMGIESLKNYKGIKIIYKELERGTPQIYTIDF